MSEEIELMMRQVKLGGMAKEWRSLQFESTEQYVTDLLKLELKEREANRINRMVKTAGFRVLKTMDDFVWTPAIELPSGLTAEYMEELQFLTPKENLVFMGTVGTGKTHLATAIALKACPGGAARPLLHGGISCQYPTGEKQQRHAEQLSQYAEKSGAYCD